MSSANETSKITAIRTNLPEVKAKLDPKLFNLVLEFLGDKKNVNDKETIPIVQKPIVLPNDLKYEGYEFIVYSRYYKHGEVHVDKYNSIQEIRKACCKEIVEYENLHLVNVDYNNPHLLKKYDEIPLRKLITMSLKMGHQKTINQDGWGWYDVLIAKNVCKYNEI
jgi:hypothetical protein